ncbi:MAG TPA: hypothetical protein VKU88_07930 [Acidimicrobiales bacterium]|nr:hypothetical protein [Acidimicrobiales bacterium]
MIASSATVLANLAYLIGAVVVAAAGGVIVWLRHRQPRSVDANMASFRRGLSALAPDPSSSPPPRRRLEPPALTHVRIEPRVRRLSPEAEPEGSFEEDAGDALRAGDNPG